MISSIFAVFNQYKGLGIIKSLWVVLRICILPFWKIDKLLPKKGIIYDIGCGEGGLTNYLYYSSPSRKLTGLDRSKWRISRANKTKNNNVKFIYGDINKKNLPLASAYILVDVLHHIDYQNQEKLLNSLAKKMRSKSLLIIKDVDNSNVIPFLFGHLFEKILYPKEKIYTRSKAEWINLFTNLNFKCSFEKGSPLFPDSTLIFICTKL